MIRRAFRLGPGPEHIGRDVDEELAFHVEMRRRKLIEAGAAPADAETEAQRQFGDLPQVRDSCITLDQQRERAMHRTRYIDEFSQDVGFALRALRRNPAFALVAILTLGLGIGANTAIFTLLDAIVLRPIPVQAPDQLVAVGNTARVNSSSNGSPRSDIISWPLYQDIAARNHSLSGLAASGRSDRLDVRLTSGEAIPEHPAGRFVSANYFSVLGIPAAHGRTFGAAETMIGASPTVVISDGYWSAHFNRDPGAVGRTLSVNGIPMTIVGVTPPGFDGEVVGARNDIWLPATMHDVLRPHNARLSDRSSSWFLLLGRRRPGVSEAQAETDLRGVVHTAMVDAAGKDDIAGVRTDTATVGPGAHGFSRVRHNFAGPLWIMLAGVALLLLIICANVANLLLARALARTPEFSVRLALGAGRGRLVRQLLTESIVLGGASALLGLGVAWAGSRLLLAMAAGGGKLPLSLEFDPRVLAFTVGVGLVAVLCFGLLPAGRAARLDLGSSLRARGVTGGLGMRGQRFPVGTAMIAGQVALSLVLLMGASLLVRSLSALESAQVGLDRDHILMASVESGERGYTGPGLQQLALNLQRRIAALPGVVAVSYSENGIFSGTESANSVDVPGWTGRTADDSSSAFDLAGPGYVSAIGAHLIAGRDFTPDDVRAEVSHVALVNQSFARFYFGNRSPIGQIFRMGSDQPVTIVGVLGDVADHALGTAPGRRFYLPLGPTLDHAVGAINLEIRTGGKPAALAPLIQRAVHAEDANLIADGVFPLTVFMRDSIAEQRLLAEVASLFGVLALLLAAIGLYGVMTYAVTRRTGEIGLRIALGADPVRLVRMVVSDAFRLVALGGLVGAPLAYAASRGLASQTATQGVDWIAVAASLGVLAVAAMVAALIPALRAARVEPLAALRQQ